MDGRRSPAHLRLIAVALVAAAALWPASGPVSAGTDGTIRGTVEIRRSQSATAARPASAGLGAAPRRPAEFRPAVTSLQREREFVARYLQPSYSGFCDAAHKANLGEFYMAVVRLLRVFMEADLAQFEIG